MHSLFFRSNTGRGATREILANDSRGCLTFTFTDTVRLWVSSGNCTSGSVAASRPLRRSPRTWFQSALIESLNWISIREQSYSNYTGSWSLTCDLFSHRLQRLHRGINRCGSSQLEPYFAVWVNLGRRCVQSGPTWRLPSFSRHRAWWAPWLYYEHWTVPGNGGSFTNHRWAIGRPHHGPWYRDHKICGTDAWVSSLRPWGLSVCGNDVLMLRWRLKSPIWTYVGDRLV